ncbi:uncharacterized protein LOC141704500 [Apium graveolens]|uniref:uncharacterized protein LOC141704500 n=1 Tax=Apium graveolens TaxID=4045 RepID=UPI003D78BC9B
MFSSEDMIGGYARKKVVKSKKKYYKDLPAGDVHVRLSHITSSSVQSKGKERMTKVSLQVTSERNIVGTPSSKLSRVLFGGEAPLHTPDSGAYWSSNITEEFPLPFDVHSSYVKRKRCEFSGDFGRTLFRSHTIEYSEPADDFLEGSNVEMPHLFSSDFEGSGNFNGNAEDFSDSGGYSSCEESDEIDKGLEEGMIQLNPDRNKRRSKRFIPEEYSSLGAPSEICSKCNDSETPKFCQLYIYDTANGVSNRLRWVNPGDQTSVDSDVVQGLITMLDETNELVHKFRQQRDRFESGEIIDLEVTLKVSRAENGRENHVGPSDEVAGIIVGDTEDTCGFRDIVIDDKIEGLVRASYVHPKLMAVQYPLLFPRGEDGFHPRIKFIKGAENATRSRGYLSMKDYYQYTLHVRSNEGMTPRLGGRLFQQYLVDAFSSIEQTRLWWFREHQTILCNELYSHICDSVRKGDSDSSNVGKGVILPAGFVGSKRYMQQNFQDALDVCRYMGHPDIFLTMTCNPLWDEILQMMEYLPGCDSANYPDIITRVFRLKLDQLLEDIKKNGYFGVCSEVMFVSAEIPDPDLDPVGYAAVKEFMIHGPCGLQNPKCACMKDMHCIRHFPKRYCDNTTFDDSGFPIYWHRQQDISVHVRKAELDNQWVVPYNRNLLVKYQCHMNVEICCHARSLKYLFKYCLKGHNRATIEVNRRKRRKKADSTEDAVDEISAYFDGRYLCGEYLCGTFAISPSKSKELHFRANESLAKVAAREKYRQSKLEAFFQLNGVDEDARQYTYDEIPQHYVWNDSARQWNRRKRGFQIGRICYTHHNSGESWFLRLLLTKVCGTTSFKSIRTVNGVHFDTFREACKEYGLLEDDNEWHEVLSQCAKGGLPPQIRQLFVHIIVNCKVTDIKNLWSCHWKHMIEDILLRRRRLVKNDKLILNEKQLEFYALGEIHELLRSIGKSLKIFDQLPQPPDSYLNFGNNNLVLEEANYDVLQMKVEYEKLLQSCNQEQMQVHNIVLRSINSGDGGLFFVYGSGGCEKTYLWGTLIAKLRSEGEIVHPVATSGIAATLMPGGRTAHSRFKIPIILDEFSVCGIGHNSDIAQLIKQTRLIIWDATHMQHRHAFECLDHSLKDIMKAVHPSRLELPFGGITVVLGGDF